MRTPAGRPRRTTRRPARASSSAPTRRPRASTAWPRARRAPLRVLDPQAALQHQRVLVELGPLARLDPALRRAHAGDAHPRFAVVHPADVLLDRLGLGPAASTFEGYELRHRSGYISDVERTEIVPMLRGVSHQWAFWCALAAAVSLGARAARHRPRSGAHLRRRAVRDARRQRPLPPLELLAARAVGCCAGSTTAPSTCSWPPATRPSACSCSTGRAGSCSAPCGPAASPAWR